VRTETLLPKRFPRPLLIGLWAAVLIGAALLALALVLSRPQLAPLSPAGELTQVSEGGGVTVKATWMVNQAAPTFAVVLDTHSVALDGYDLRGLAILRAGDREVAPTTWEAPAGGHHRTGTLTFPTAAADGSPLITPQTRQVELVLRSIGDVPERVLTWAR
jgi:hypothetical protein